MFIFAFTDPQTFPQALRAFASFNLLQALASSMG